VNRMVSAPWIVRVRPVFVLMARSAIFHLTLTKASGSLECFASSINVSWCLGIWVVRVKSSSEDVVLRLQKHRCR